MGDTASRTRRRCRSCRTVLALDNATGLCGTCTTTAREHLVAPPAVLPGFWDHTEIRQALADRHMGRVIAAYRRHPTHRAPIRQSDTARWAGMSQVRISQIENGAPIKHLDTLIFWAKLIGIPAHLLWFQLPGRPHPARSSPRTAPAPGLGRYRLFRLGAPDPAENQDMAVMRALRAADPAVGGGHVYRELTHYLNTELAPRLLSGEDDDPMTFVAAAGMVEMAGWMAHDAGRDDRAAKQFTRARTLSRLGPDRHLTVHILASLSHLDLHRAQPESAIRHAYDAQSELAKVPSHPELEARLLAMQARGYAQLGQSRQAHVLLDRAAETVTATPANSLSPWVSRFDLASLATEAARCSRHLGELDQAADQAQQVIDLRPPDRVRSRAFAQLTLAAVLAAQGHPEQACAVATEVIDSTQDLASYLIVQHLADVRGQLSPYSSSPVVISFIDYLRETIRTRTWIPAMVSTQDDQLSVRS